MIDFADITWFLMRLLRKEPHMKKFIKKVKRTIMRTTLVIVTFAVIMTVASTLSINALIN